MSMEIPEYSDDLARAGYHRAWFTLEHFASAEANGYVRARGVHGLDIVRNGDWCQQLQQPIRMWLFEKPIANFLPAARPQPAALVATLRPGDAIIALTIWKDHVILATTTGVYIMADQDPGFVPMKMTYEEKPDGR